MVLRLTWSTKHLIQKSWCGVACGVAGNMPSGRGSENTPVSDSGDTGSNNDSGKVLIPDTEGVSNNITDIMNNVVSL